MKKIIKVVNNVFILIVLFLFYLIPLGIVSFIYKAFYRKKAPDKTFWQEADVRTLDKNYFQSSY